MSSSIPKFQTFITVQEFRDLVKQYFHKQITEDHRYDPRDIQRFNELDAYTLMFIQHGQLGSSFDQDRALSVFDGSMSWRKRHDVHDISVNAFPAEYFDRHAIYFQNRDRYNHPILHFLLRALKRGQEDNEAIKRFITYHFEQHIREHPGERIVLLFDMTGAGVSHLDYTLVKFIIACAQILYPGLVGYILIYKMSFLLSMAWKFISNWIVPEAKEFVKFVDEKSIGEYVPSDHSAGKTSTRF